MASIKSWREGFGGSAEVDIFGPEMYVYQCCWPIVFDESRTSIGQGSWRKLMSVSEVSMDDGVVFARSIRSLAGQAHQILQGPATDREIRGLIGRIDRLEQEATSQGSEELVRWLGSLRRVVDEQVMASV